MDQDSFNGWLGQFVMKIFFGNFIVRDDQIESQYNDEQWRQNNNTVTHHKLNYTQNHNVFYQWTQDNENTIDCYFQNISCVSCINYDNRDIVTTNRDSDSIEDYTSSGIES